MRNLGIVVFSSNTGLGNQSRRLTQMLLPERILLIDNTSFTKNKQQHPEWYQGFNGFISNGFPTNSTVKAFLNGLTHLFLIENPLNWFLIEYAKRLGIKTYIQTNYEFCDNLKHPHLPIPDKFLMPSYWKVEEMKQKFGENTVQYLPPPIFPEDFKEVREYNFNRQGIKKRFLHVMGTLAAEDRNGTLDLLKSLAYIDADFELVIKSQHELPQEYAISDKRVLYKFGDEPEVANIYKDFDAMIMPRKFGGLCLPMQEALMSGLPVIMTDISPNKEILPREWVVPALRSGSIFTRTNIDLYSADPILLGAKLTEFANKDENSLSEAKVNAFDLAYTNFSPSTLREAYEQLWK